MKSKLFELAASDVFSGLWTALFSAIVVMLASVATQPGFNVFEANWTEILNKAINISFVTLIAHLSKSFLSNKEDKLLGGLISGKE